MTKTLYKTKYLELKSTLTDSGEEWVYAHRPNAKDVILIIPIVNDEILFLIEKRPPLNAENIGKYSIALPAGLVGDEREGETIQNALQAELLEETGLIAKNYEIKAKKVASSPGCITETITIAIANIENKKTVQKPISDNGVIIDRIWINKKDIHSWLKEMENKGYIITGQTLAALFYLYEGDKL